MSQRLQGSKKAIVAARQVISGNPATIFVEKIMRLTRKLHYSSVITLEYSGNLL